MFICKKERGSVQCRILFYLALFQVFFAHDEDEIDNRTKLMESLKTALRTQPMRWDIANNHSAATCACHVFPALVIVLLRPYSVELNNLDLQCFHLAV